MSDRNIILTTNEQNTVTEALMYTKKDRIKHKQNFEEIDRAIDKISGRVTLFKINQRYIELYNGVEYEEVFKCGKFQSEHGTFIIQDINEDNTHIKVNGNWHHKGEFEPAIVIQARASKKGKAR